MLLTMDAENYTLRPCGTDFSIAAIMARHGQERERRRRRASADNASKCVCVCVFFLILSVPIRGRFWNVACGVLDWIIVKEINGGNLLGPDAPGFLSISLSHGK